MDLAPKPASASRTIQTQILLSQHINGSGRLVGGRLVFQPGQSSFGAGQLGEDLLIDQLLLVVGQGVVSRTGFYNGWFAFQGDFIAQRVDQGNDLVDAVGDLHAAVEKGQRKGRRMDIFALAGNGGDHGVFAVDRHAADAGGRRFLDLKANGAELSRIFRRTVWARESQPDDSLLILRQGIPGEHPIIEYSGLHEAD